MPTTNIRTYHCICSELVLAVSTPLEELSKRQSDKAHICTISESELALPGCVVLSGSTMDRDAPVVLKLEDGFEKRYFLQCRRCDLKVAYRLDKSQFGEAGDGVREDVLYVLPGALVRTEEVRRVGEGKRNGQEGVVADGG